MGDPVAYDTRNDDERRISLRINCNVPVRCEGLEEPFEGCLKDVSQKGMRIELQLRLTRGLRLRVFRPNVQLEPVSAVVRWCRRHARKDLMLAGLELDMENADIEKSWVQPILSTFLFLQSSGGFPEIPPPQPVVPEPQEPEQEMTPAAPDPPSPEVEELPTLTIPVQPHLAENLLTDQKDEVDAKGEEQEERPPLPIPEAVPPQEPAAEVEPVLAELLENAVEPSQADATPPPDVPLPELSTEEWTLLLKSAQQKLQPPKPPLINQLLKGFREFAFEDVASIEERRRCSRLYCHYEAALETGSQTANAAVIDLSPAGLGLMVEKKIAKGSLVRLLSPQSLPGFAPVQCLVRYCRAYRERFRVGLELRSDLISSWLNPALKEVGLSGTHLEQKRRYVRAQTSLPIEVRNWKGDFELGTLLDLSRGGALLRTLTVWEIGEVLRLILGPVGYLPTLHLRAVALNQRPDGQHWLVNVNFVDIAGTNLSRLDRYIKAILAHRVEST